MTLGPSRIAATWASARTVRRPSAVQPGVYDTLSNAWPDAELPRVSAADADTELLVAQTMRNARLLLRSRTLGACSWLSQPLAVVAGRGRVTLLACQPLKALCLLGAPSTFYQNYNQWLITKGQERYA
jgi:hypothetical protein